MTFGFWCCIFVSEYFSKLNITAMSNYKLTTESQVRNSFWKTHPYNRRMKKSNGVVRYFEQNDYPADVRAAFVFYVDFLQKDGVISEELAYNITLK